MTHFSDKIDWKSSKNEILINPRVPNSDRISLMKAFFSIKNYKSHIWLTSSGSSGKLKLIALSKEAMLCSAAAVNSHLKSTASDIWYNPLPSFHVGGLAIYARSYLSGAQVVNGFPKQQRWNLYDFVKSIHETKATLTSLVPAQLFDLIVHQIPCPSSLRAVIIGGGALSEKIYMEAIEKGWKILPSYGMTECSSQVATAELGSWEKKTFPSLEPLKHMNLKMNPDGYLQINSSALLTGMMECDSLSKSWRLFDPKLEGWLTTYDKAIMENGAITSISRGEFFIKIGGESVDLLRLNKILEQIIFETKISGDFAIFPYPHPRLGHVIHCAVANIQERNSDKIMAAFNEKVFPFERIKQIHHLDSIPRSSLNKILLSELLIKVITPS